MFLIPMTYRHSKGFSEMLLEVKKSKDEGKLRNSKLRYLAFSAIIFLGGETCLSGSSHLVHEDSEI